MFTLCICMPTAAAAVLLYFTRFHSILLRSGCSRQCTRGLASLSSFNLSALSAKWIECHDSDASHDHLHLSQCTTQRQCSVEEQWWKLPSAVQLAASYCWGRPVILLTQSFSTSETQCPVQKTHSPRSLSHTHHSLSFGFAAVHSASRVDHLSCSYCSECPFHLVLFLGY